MIFDRRAICIIELQLDDKEQNSLLEAINEVDSLDFKLSKGNQELAMYRFEDGDDFGETKPFLYLALDKSTVNLLASMLEHSTIGLVTSIENNVLSFKSEIADIESVHMSSVKSRAELGLAQDLAEDEEVDLDLDLDDMLLNPLGLDVFGYEPESDKIDLNNFSDSYHDGVDTSYFDFLYEPELKPKKKNRRRIRRKRGRR